jgi:hypothetical protein
MTNTWSRWAELNCRPTPYHGVALPLSYIGKQSLGPLENFFRVIHFALFFNVWTTRSEAFPDTRSNTAAYTGVQRRADSG